MIDVVHQINAVRRQVGSRVLDAGAARTVVVSQTYAATLDDVWDACTDPERISRWFLPVSGDLRPGGRYQFEGNAGGTIERCDPPHGFVATWEYGETLSWIEVRLSTEPDDRTRFELEHVVPDDEQWAEFGPGAVGVGWDMALIGLTMHLPGGAEVDRAAVAAWVGSDQGRHFMSTSSRRWCAASIGAGADETEAQAAADRTTAAYTGTPTAS